MIYLKEKEKQYDKICRIEQCFFFIISNAEKRAHSKSVAFLLHKFPFNSFACHFILYVFLLRCPATYFYGFLRMNSSEWCTRAYRSLQRAHHNIVAVKFTLQIFYSVWHKLLLIHLDFIVCVCVLYFVFKWFSLANRMFFSFLSFFLRLNYRQRPAHWKNASLSFYLSPSLKMQNCP